MASKADKKIGWDATVLGMGTIGGVFANPDVRAMHGESWTLILAVLAFAVCLACSIAVAYLRKVKKPTGKKSFVALALGGGALAIPAYLVLTLK